LDLYRSRSLTDFTGGAILVAAITGFFTYGVYVSHFGVSIIGDVFERPEFRTIYWGEISRDGSGSTIRVKAEIEVSRSYDEFESTDSIGNPSTTTLRYRKIHVRRIYFNNGSKVDIIDGDPLEDINDSVYLTDANGQSWYFTLLPERVDDD
jgi:hypothetical protein